MSARHAVLALLIQKPDYPYKLAARFADQIGPAWQVNIGQVYQTIERLEREGLIKAAGSSPNARGTRCTYEATELGVEELERWIEDANEAIRPQRSTLSLKLAMSEPEHAQQLLEAIDRQEQACLQSLREYSSSLRLAERLTERWKTIMYRLILEAAIRQIESEVNWLRQVRREILIHSGLGSEHGGRVTDVDGARRGATRGQAARRDSKRA